MSESVSGVDAILAGLRESAARTQEITMGPPIVTLQSAEAAVHATVREIEDALREAADVPDDERAWYEDAADLVARRFGGTE